MFLYGRGTENRTLIYWVKASYFKPLSYTPIGFRGLCFRFIFFFSSIHNRCHQVIYHQQHYQHLVYLHNLDSLIPT